MPKTLHAISRLHPKAGHPPLPEAVHKRHIARSAQLQWHVSHDGLPVKPTPVNQRLCDRLADISPHHPALHRADSIERLAEEHLPALAEEWHRQRGQALAGLSPREASARHYNLALGRNLTLVLRHGPRLLRDFSPDLGELRALPGSHLAQLERESGESVLRMLETPARRTQALAYAALIDPRDHAALGIVLVNGQAREVERMRQRAVDGLLDRRTVLQLRDYAHADTGSFNFYRAVSLLAGQGPTLDVRLLFDDLVGAFAQGVERLWTMPQARVPGGEVRKGWIANELLPLVPDTVLDLDRPLSATSRPAASYLLRRTDGEHRYDTELILRSGVGQPLKAVHFCIFNAPATVHEDEAMVLPHQRFVVEKVVEEDVHDGRTPQPVTRCLLRKTAESDPQQRDR